MNKIHVIDSALFPRPAEVAREFPWEVWLDTEIRVFDGLCIGLGKSRDDALRDAEKELLGAIDQIRARSRCKKTAQIAT